MSTQLAEPEYYRRWKALEGGKDPYPYGNVIQGIGTLARRFEDRDAHIADFSFAIPSNEALQAIAEVSPMGVIEIGAGGGYWAFCLQGYGVDVLAYDAGNEEQKKYGIWTERPPKLWFPVQTGGIEQVARYPERTLLLCWPPYDEPMAFHALKAYQGDTVVYIGEGWGGCTADDDFHDELENGWSEVRSVSIPQWWGMHDALWVYHRTGRKQKTLVL